MVYDTPVSALSAGDIIILMCLFGIVLLIASAIASAMLER
jgi:hypothetical protein